MKLNHYLLSFLVLVTLLPASSGKLSAQTDAPAMPENSYQKKYGFGWECNRGFKKKDNACIPIKVPENAHLSSHGSDWKCKRGFLKNDDICKAVIVPANAYLVDARYGMGWKCERGYRSNHNGFREEPTQCIKIEVPKKRGIKRIWLRFRMGM